jgi:hypothetical protein
MHKIFFCLSFFWVLLAIGSSTVLAQQQSPLVYDNPVFKWEDNRDSESPRVSPSAVVGLQLGSTRVMISYGRPGVKGRQIFGGLVPYGKVWRTGADEATTITVTGKVAVEGKELPAGTYSLFTIPDKQEWTIIFNKNNNQWGAYSYDQGKDFLRIKASSQKSSNEERLSIGFQDIDTDSASASVAIAWADTKVAFKIQEAK